MQLYQIVMVIRINKENILNIDIFSLRKLRVIDFIIPKKKFYAKNIQEK